MKRSKLLLAVIVVVLAIVLVTALAAAPAHAPSAKLPTFRTVVVVLAPYLTWDDVASGRTPAIEALAQDGAIAGASVRATSIADDPDALRGAAVLSAGRPVDRPEADGTVPGAPHGALGSAIRGAGGRTAAIGTSAGRATDALGMAGAPAAFVARDTAGMIDEVEVSARLLRSDETVAGGLTTDLDVLELAYRDALDATADGGPTLIVIDAGDGERARSAAGVSGAWEHARRDAVAVTDETVRVAMRSLPRDAALIVVSTAEYATTGSAGFGPVLVYGAGPGVLRSAATRIDGTVTLPDVSVTALSLLGVEPPAAMTGAVLEIVPTAVSGAERVESRALADARARSLEALRTPVWFAFLGACVGVLAYGVLAAVRGLPGAEGRGGRWIGGAVVVLLSVPLGAMLAMIGPDPASSQAGWVRLALGCSLTAGAALAVARRRGRMAAATIVAGLTVLAIVLDQLSGGSLAVNGVFSYSTLFGARYYGLGNEGAGIVIGALLVVVGSRVDWYGESRARGFIGAGLAVAAVAVLPSIGANLGVAAWGVAGVFAAYLYARRRRVTVRLVLWGLAAALALLGIAVLVEAATPGGSHLGEALAGVLGGGAGPAELVVRKIALSLAIVQATPFSLLLPVVLVLVIRLLASPTGALGGIVSGSRGLGAAIAGVCCAAIVALVTEDSGAVVAALVLLFPLSVLVMRAVAPEEAV